MEAFPAKFCRGIRSYWRTRKYQRLRDGSTSKKTGKVVRFGGNRTGSTRRFKLRSILKIRIKALNPVRLLARLRDAYVDAMMGVAGRSSSISASDGPQALTVRRIPKARSVKPKPGDFESRLIMEIYKSVMESKEFSAMSSSSKIAT